MLIDDLLTQLNIYVIHYTPLKERKAFLKTHLSDLSLKNIEYIEKHDKEDLTQNHLIKFKPNTLRMGTISLVIKQIYAMELIQQNNFDFNLILEDDVVLSNNFVNLMTEGIKQLPKDYDMLFIGDGCNLHIPKSELKPNQLIYKKCVEPTSWGGNGATRCTDSMLISKKGAKKICDYFHGLKPYEISLPLDWWLNDTIRKLNLDIYWMEPTIVTQGTQNGMYRSSH